MSSDSTSKLTDLKIIWNIIELMTIASISVMLIGFDFKLIDVQKYQIVNFSYLMPSHRECVILDSQGDEDLALDSHYRELSPH